MHFQLHFLYQIRVIGDMYVLQDDVQQIVPDFQEYLNGICTKYD